MAEQGTNWKAMLKDKKLWIGAGIAGAIGLVVFLRKGGSAGSEGAAGGPGGTPLAGAGYVAQGGGDTTGSNIAAWLSQYSASMDASNQAYQKHLTDTLTALLQGQGGGQTTPDARYVGVVEGNHLLPWLESVNSSLGLNLTQEKLLELNPGLNIAQANKYGYISASNPANRPGGGDLTWVINSHTNKQLRVQ